MRECISIHVGQVRLLLIQSIFLGLLCSVMLCSLLVPCSSHQNLTETVGDLALGWQK